MPVSGEPVQLGGTFSPDNKLDIGAALSLPPIPPQDVMLYSALTDARSRAALKTLTLAFHYEASAGECGREVLVPGQPKLSLTADKVSEVAVRLPPKGELTFTCGMNMLTGTLIVQ